MRYFCPIILIIHHSLTSSKVSTSSNNQYMYINNSNSLDTAYSGFKDIHRFKDSPIPPHNESIAELTETKLTY